MSFPFILILENTDDGTFERITGHEPGRPMFGETKPTIPAIATNGQAHERAVWGCWHPGHNDRNPFHDPRNPFSRAVVPFESPRFAYGGVWYDDLDAWAAAWRATITGRVACDRGGEPTEAHDPCDVHERLAEAQAAAWDR